MRYLVILALGALAACSSAGAREEEKYDMVKRQAEKVGVFKYRTLCPQSRAVAAAYLEDRNEAKYQEWKLTADLDCGLASEPYAK